MSGRGGAYYKNLYGGGGFSGGAGRGGGGGQAQAGRSEGGGGDPKRVKLNDSMGASSEFELSSVPGTGPCWKGPRVELISFGADFVR